MSVYLVGQATVKDAAALAAYAEKAGPTIPAGATVLALDESTETIEGDGAPPRTIIIEFPSREAFRAWYDSPEYQAVLPLRLRAAPGNACLVEGVPPPSA